jgi:LysR family transcriptional regulator, hydrogen peroxide-inducible genes activator
MDADATLGTVPMETREIRYFLAAARTLNFTQAASECSVSQPALTRAIKKLEEEFGGALFYRFPAGVQLTQLGQSLLPRFEELQRSLDLVQVEAQLATEVLPDKLRLGVMCTISPRHVTAVLGKLKAQHTSAVVNIFDARAQALIEMLLADSIDMALTAQPSYPDIVAVLPLYTERYAVAFVDGHQLAQSEEVPLAQVANAAYLERLGCEFDQHLEAQYDTTKYEWDIRFSSEREDWIQALVLAGEGCAIVPEHLPCLPGITKRPLTEPVISRTVVLATLRGRPLFDAARRFAQLSQAHDWRSLA